MTGPVVHEETAEPSRQAVRPAGPAAFPHGDDMVAARLP